MSDQSKLHSGFIPSLESLPFFSESIQAVLAHEPKIFTNYGELAREMLTGQIDLGLLPWEVFVADIFALPKQRTNWHLDLWIQANAMELVLSRPLYRCLHAEKFHSPPKIPARVVIGIENQHSLARHQFYDWLLRKKMEKKIEIQFRMLPLDLMRHSLSINALDGYVVPAPWGWLSQESEEAKRDETFQSELYPQSMVLVRKKAMAQERLFPKLDAELTAIRKQLAEPLFFHEASVKMMSYGKFSLDPLLLKQAADFHDFPSFSTYALPDLASVKEAFLRLKQLAVLPAQLDTNEMTAKLLL